ncbi:MAG: type V CRISPR-associated protein Cas12b, partial [Candidatus Hydrogenedentes bacterium]|nr:type V CRISPR-associated protein Cas12b [Candidatus Hydrogenedentota bacterium]
ENLAGQIGLTLPLLSRDEEQTLRESEFSIRLARSGQFSDIHIEQSSGKKIAITYRSGHQDFVGDAGGSEILFDRSYLEHPERTDAVLAEGAPGSVWFKLTLDVASQAPKEWLGGKGKPALPLEASHFKTALDKKSKHEAKLQAGLRVLSVDMGLRTFASCSVFQLVQGKPAKGLFFPAADGKAETDPEKLWAKHLRSFKLALPGEEATEQERTARAEAMKEIRALKQMIWRLKEILRLGEANDDEKRDRILGKLLDTDGQSADTFTVLTNRLEPLQDSKFRSDSELWQRHCQTVYDGVEALVSEQFSAWRKRTRPRPQSWDEWRDRRAYHGGKSMWMLEYLDGVRKLILSWNLRGRSYGEVNRQDKKAYGTVASRLLKHINKLKGDRTKTGADLLVQAARGYVPDKNGPGWIQSHEPCRLILFEDLARYRFRVDRPRRENSQLMKWNHREIVAECTMQAELYAIHVDTTAAGYSSRYLASNGAPGVRCRHLHDGDFDDQGIPKRHVVNELGWLARNGAPTKPDDAAKVLSGLIKPGMLVPWTGGELFATLNPEGTAHLIHADINAAQNLQRRFWGRCGEAFRISCKKTQRDERDCYELETLPGARLLGALQQLENGTPPFYLSDADNPGHFRMEKAGGKRIKAVAKDDGDDDLEELLDLPEEKGGRETFFRDPAGIFFNAATWAPSKAYWGAVKGRVGRALLDAANDASEGDSDEYIPF